MLEANYCSFCGRHRTDVAKVVSGPAGVGICNDCHETMRSLMPEPVPVTPEERAAMNESFDEFLASTEAKP